MPERMLRTATASLTRRQKDLFSVLVLSRIEVFAPRRPEVVRSEITRIDLRIAEVPSSRSGDRVEIDGEALLIQGEPVRERERLL